MDQPQENNIILFLPSNNEATGVLPWLIEPSTHHYLWNFICNQSTLLIYNRSTSSKISIELFNLNWVEPTKDHPTLYIVSTWPFNLILFSHNTQFYIWCHHGHPILFCFITTAQFHIMFYRCHLISYNILQWPSNFFNHFHYF